MSLSEEFAAELEQTVETVIEEAKAEQEGDETGNEIDAKAEETNDQLAASNSEGEGEGTTEGEGTEEGEADPVIEVSDGALQKAVLAGIPLEQARKFSSDESLLQVIGAVQDAATTLAGDAKGGSDENSEEDDDPLAALPKLDPKDVAPEIVEAFESLNGVVKAQQEELKAFREQQQQAPTVESVAAAREVESWFDGRVESLGEDFTEALGTGGYSTLEKGSPQLAKRDAIANQVAVILSGHEATGQEPPPREKVFDMAARSVLTEEYAAVEKKISKDLEERARGHISRAGGQNAKSNQSPEDETASLIDEKFGVR